VISTRARLRDVLQRLDHTLGGPPYNLSLQESTLSTSQRRLLEHNRRRLPLAPANLAADRPRDGVRVGVLVLLQSGTAGNCRWMPPCGDGARAPPI